MTVKKNETIQSPKKKMTKEEIHRYIAKMREYDAELLAGIFENIENPGMVHQFVYKGWPGEGFERYELHHGQRYKLPRGVVRHLNKGCCYAIYKPLSDQFGSSVTPGNAPVNVAYNDGRLGQQFQIREIVHRFRFIPLDFMEDDLFPNELTLVEEKRV